VRNVLKTSGCAKKFGRRTTGETAIMVSLKKYCSLPYLIAHLLCTISSIKATKKTHLKAQSREQLSQAFHKKKSYNIFLKKCGIKYDKKERTQKKEKREDDQNHLQQRN